MHNLKEIRKDFDTFRKAIEKRSVEVNFEKLKDLDIKNRELIQKKEAIEKEIKIEYLISYYEIFSDEINYMEVSNRLLFLSLS